MIDKDKIVDELLDMRDECTGKGIMYIMIPNEDPNDIRIATPKNIFSPSELDDFIRFMLEHSNFSGKMEQGSQNSVWDFLIKKVDKKQFFSFDLVDAKIELVGVSLKDIIQQKP